MSHSDAINAKLQTHRFSSHWPVGRRATGVPGPYRQAVRQNTRSSDVTGQSWISTRNLSASHALSVFMLGTAACRWSLSCDCVNPAPSHKAVPQALAGRTTARRQWLSRSHWESRLEDYRKNQMPDCRHQLRVGPPRGPCESSRSSVP